MALKCVCLYVLFACVTAATFAAHIQQAAELAAATTTTSETVLTRYAPDIVDGLKDIIRLIPSATVDELVAEHFLIDKHFRTALNYLRSSDFKHLLQRAEQIPEVTKILDFIHLTDHAAVPLKQLHLAADTDTDTDTADMANFIVPRMEIVLLDVAVELGYGASDASEQLQNNYVLLPQQQQQHRNLHHNLGSFTSFVEQLLNHLPRAEYQQTINAHRQKSAIFAEFYAAIRSPDFHTMVEEAMKSVNVASVIKTLNNNDIDVKELLPILYKVISWGP